jgi:hypothetical protein
VGLPSSALRFAVTTEHDVTQTGPALGRDHALPEPPEVPNLEVLGLIGHGGMGVAVFQPDTPLGEGQDADQACAT